MAIECTTLYHSYPFFILHEIFSKVSNRKRILIQNLTHARVLQWKMTSLQISLLATFVMHEHTTVKFFH